VYRKKAHRLVLTRRGGVFGNVAPGTGKTASGPKGTGVVAPGRSAGEGVTLNPGTGGSQKKEVKTQKKPLLHDNPLTQDGKG